MNCFNSNNSVNIVLVCFSLSLFTSCSIYSTILLLLLWGEGEEMKEFIVFFNTIKSKSKHYKDTHKVT